MLFITKITGFICALFLLSSCASTITTQNIPVSTNPSGAQVIVDGKQSCVTPCAVELGRNQDHLLTLEKSGYSQQDVSIKRQHQTEMELLKAINTGVNSATFFKDSAMGLNSAVQSLSTHQATGEAYVLVPSTVAVTLVPAGGFSRQSTYPEATQSLQKDASPLDLMDNNDEHMLETALEASRTGQPSVWTNNESGLSFAVEPEEAKTVNGYITRYFKVGVKKGNDNITARYHAYRAGRGEWVVGEPPLSSQTSDTTTAKTEPDSSGVVRALAETPWPRAKKDWTLKESSTTSTKQEPDGSIDTKSTSSSVKAGVSVGPGAVIGILDALKSIEPSQ